MHSYLHTGNISGTGMNIGTEITGGEVAVEVGVDLTVTTTGVEKEIIVGVGVGVEAAVKVLTTGKIVEEADMTMTGEVEVGLMEGIFFGLIYFSSWTLPL